MTILTTFTVSTGAPSKPGVEAIDAKGADAVANAEDAPKGGIGLKQDNTMKFRIICRLLAIAAFVSCFLASAQIRAQLAYIPNSEGNRTGHDNVSVINTATNTVAATINIGSAGFPERPWGVAVTPDGSRVYVTASSPGSGGNVVDVIDTATNNETATIRVGKSPHGVAVIPDGSKAYVANRDSNNVSVIDTATNKVTATIHVDRPLGMVVSPNGRSLYVTSFVERVPADNLSVIDTETNKVTAVISAGVNPAGVAVTPDGSRLYVAALTSRL